MWRKIRTLDFDDAVKQIQRATDSQTRTVRDPIIQRQLVLVTDSANAVGLLRDSIAHAVVAHTKRLDDIRADSPFVHALVRCQHHPDASPLPTLEVEGGLEGPDAAPRLNEIVAAHPELTWDPDAIQGLLIGAIVNGAGDVEVDDKLPPWLISWIPMGAAAFALVILVTLRELGDL